MSSSDVKTEIIIHINNALDTRPMATKKLFRQDPYKTECEATVSSINENRITLDRTVFFAFSGGQASDEGTIAGIPVKEAVVSGDDIIYELGSPPSFKEGDSVHVKIDNERRERLMKLHSAAHIIYSVFNKRTGAPKLIGSNVSEEKGRLDYEHPENIKPLLPELEGQTNRFLSQNIPIETHPDPEDPDRWWWVCEDWKIPCGGTHVRATKEISAITLKRKNIGGGKERIEITLK